MSVRAADLRYPLLCLTREIGVCIVRSAQELERCNGAVFWRGKFFDGLRLVDAEGQTHEIVRATIRRPASSIGQRVARFLELTISVEVEARSGTPVSVAELKRIIEKAAGEDAESFEEFSGNSVDWWNRALAACESVADLMRALQRTDQF